MARACSSYTSEVRVNIVGLSAPPASVSSFSVIASNGYALASWALSPDQDVQINGSIIIRHSSKTSSAVWEGGIILEDFPGGAVQGIVALITDTYMAKAKDSTSNYSTSCQRRNKTDPLLGYLAEVKRSRRRFKARQQQDTQTKVKVKRNSAVIVSKRFPQGVQEILKGLAILLSYEPFQKMVRKLLC